MTVDEFRKMALSLPEALEAAHMGHADFRVRGKIFATLGYPAVGWPRARPRSATHSPPRGPIRRRSRSPGNVHCARECRLRQGQ